MSRSNPPTDPICAHPLGHTQHFPRHPSIPRDWSVVTHICDIGSRQVCPTPWEHGHTGGRWRHPGPSCERDLGARGRVGVGPEAEFDRHHLSVGSRVLLHPLTVLTASPSGWEASWRRLRLSCRIASPRTLHVIDVEKNVWDIHVV